MQNLSRNLFIGGIISLTLASIWYGIKPEMIWDDTTNSQYLRAASILDSRTPLAAFKLQATTGEEFTNSSLKGHWSLMYFGYADCPHICPDTLTILSRAWDKLGSNGNNIPVRLLFTSLDPAKDDVLKLQNFVTRFHPEFVGLTGSEAEVARLSKQLGIYYEVLKDYGDKKLINHTGALFLVNPKGKLHAVFSPPLDADFIAQDLEVIIRG